MREEYCKEYCSKLSRFVIESLLKNKLAARKEGSTKKDNVCTDLTCLDYKPKTKNPTDCELLHERLGRAKKTLVHAAAVVDQDEASSSSAAVMNDGNVQRPTTLAFVTFASDTSELAAALGWLQSAQAHVCTNAAKYALKFHVILPQSLKQEDLSGALSSLSSGAGANAALSVRAIWLGATDTGAGKATAAAARDYASASALLQGSGGMITSWADASAVDLAMHEGSPPQSSFDFVYVTEPNQLFQEPSTGRNGYTVGDVCDDIMGVRVAVTHASYWDKKILRTRGAGAFPHVKAGAAHIPDKKFEMNPWFSISMFGGRTADVTSILNEMAAMQATDSKAGAAVSKSSGEGYLNAVLSRPEFTPTSELSRAFNWFKSTAACKKLYASGGNLAIDPDLSDEYCTKVIAVIRRA